MAELSTIIAGLAQALADRDAAKEMLADAEQRVARYEAEPALQRYVASLGVSHEPDWSATPSPEAVAEAMVPPPPEALRIGDYARARGVSGSMVYQLVSRGDLTAPAVLPGGMILPEAADKQLAAALRRGRLLTSVQHAIAKRHHNGADRD